jgi:hypothetical protein
MRKLQKIDSHVLMCARGIEVSPFATFAKISMRKSRIDIINIGQIMLQDFPWFATPIFHTMPALENNEGKIIFCLLIRN